LGDKDDNLTFLAPTFVIYVNVPCLN
jgi:hypothetical protein